MTLIALAILYAMVLWWFSTGAILFLDGLPQRTFRWSMAGGTALMALAVYGLIGTSTDTSLGGAYAGFTIGLTAWGWLEMGYYMGFMMGPRRRAAAEGTRGWRLFWNATETTLYHELAALALSAVIAAVTWDMPNKVAFWTFQILWWMQISAKLNVFLGVPNLAENFLPPHLAFLRGFMARKPMNPFFPVSITAQVVLATLLGLAVGAARTPFAAAGSTMMATLVVLSIVEHWVLVVPLPVDRLWTWSLKSRKAAGEVTSADRADDQPARRRAAAFTEQGRPLPLPPLDGDRFTLDRSAALNR